MAKKIEDLYREHMQANSPDMDKLWAKIETRIDEKEQGAPAKTEAEKPKITVKHSSVGKYIAIAACLTAVIAGTAIFLSTKENKIETDNESVNVSYAAPAEAESYQPEAKKDNADSDATKNYKAEINKRDTEKYQTNGDNESAAASTDEDSGKDVSSAGAAAPKERIKALMKEDEYRNADLEGKIKLIEKLAAEMKTAGDITAYEIKRRETNNRIEITMPDETIIGIMIK